MLSKQIKDALLKKAEDIELDDKYLERMEEEGHAYWDNNIYGVEPQYAVGGMVYDDELFFAYSLIQLADWVENDGLGEYVDLADDEDLDGEMTLEASCWLRDYGESLC